MKQVTRMLVSTYLLTSFFGTMAAAEEIMDTAQLNALIMGNTLYVQISAGAPGATDGGTAPIYYAENGSAAALLPTGLKLVGSWTLFENKYCIDWDNGPKNSCTQLVRTSDGFVVLDAGLGEPRGIISTIAVGNPEDL